MKIRYELSLDDVVAFSLYQARTEPGIRRNLLKSQAMYAGLLAALGLVVGAATDSWLPAAAGAAVAALFWLRYPRALRRSLARRVQDGPNRDCLVPHELEVNDQAVINRIEHHEESVAWPWVRQVVEVDDRLFILFGTMRAFVIPRAGMREGDYDRLCDELRARLKARGS